MLCITLGPAVKYVTVSYAVAVWYVVVTVNCAVAVRFVVVLLVQLLNI